jgi:hypothetical protein
MDRSSDKDMDRKIFISFDGSKGLNLSIRIIGSIQYLCVRSRMVLDVVALVLLHLVSLSYKDARRQSTPHENRVSCHHEHHDHQPNRMKMVLFFLDDSATTQQAPSRSCRSRRRRKGRPGLARGGSSREHVEQPIYILKVFYI